MEVLIFITIITGLKNGVLTASTNDQCDIHMTQCQSKLTSDRIGRRYDNDMYTNDCLAYQAYTKCLKNIQGCSFSVPEITNCTLPRIGDSLAYKCDQAEFTCGIQLLKAMSDYLETHGLRYRKDEKEYNCRTIQTYKQCMNSRVECPYNETEVQIRLRGYDITCAAAELTSFISLSLMSLVAVVTTHTVA